MAGQQDGSKCVVVCGSSLEFRGLGVWGLGFRGLGSLHEGSRRGRISGSGAEHGAGPFFFTDLGRLSEQSALC